MGRSLLAPLSQRTSLKLLSLGHFFFLVFINDPLNCLSDGPPRMFADDTNITFRSKKLSDVQTLINSELQNLNTWLIANRLCMNIAKTDFIVIGWRQQLATFDCELCVSINGKQLKQVKSKKTLGIFPDENLTWKNHVDQMVKKV